MAGARAPTQIGPTGSEVILRLSRLGGVLGTHTSAYADRSALLALEWAIFGDLFQLAPSFGQQTRKAMHGPTRNFKNPGDLQEGNRGELVAGGGFEPPTFGL